MLHARKPGPATSTRANPSPPTFGYRWDYAETLDDGSGNSRTDLVMLEQWDLANLVAGNKLLPLDEHLTSDSGFDPGAYWPGILETGKVEGVQYALPVAASPWITVVNRDLAAAAEYEIPPREAWDSQAFVEAALTMHGDPEAPGGSDALGLLLNVEPMWGAPDQLWSWTPSFLFLQSALGALPDSQGSFAALALAPGPRHRRDLLRSRHHLRTGRERRQRRRAHLVPLHPGPDRHAHHVPRRPRVRLDDPQRGA